MRKKTVPSAEAEAKPLIERLHPSLREQFIPLPDDQTPSIADCTAVFGGDHRALYEITRLVFEMDENAAQ